MKAVAVTRIGTAGWNVPRAVAASFPDAGRHLTRYAQVLSCVEINSSFHRPHRAATYARWADETPASFRFSVKLPRTITHDAKLHEVGTLLDRFVDEAGSLGDKLGALLVQLPPSLAFEATTVDAFFLACRDRTGCALVCEPRHRSWFVPEADALMEHHRVARAAADPALDERAARPGGWDGVAYYRWHGSPRTYWSAYDDAWLVRQVDEVSKRAREREVWCVFDNTAAGAAIDDALRFARLLGTGRAKRPRRAASNA